MALAGLKGPIKSVKLFDDPKNPLHLDTPIAGYLGDTLCITHADLDAKNVLVITVDDQGPPIMPRFPQTTFSAVKILISYNKGPFSTAQTSTATVAYGGMPLILTGTVTFDPTIKYADAEVVLAISEWKSPKRGLEYIVVQQSQDPLKPLPKENELRWFSTPIEVSEASAPGAADVIPLHGLGVQGPFGLQTPS